VAFYAAPTDQCGGCIYHVQVEVLGLVLSNPAPPDVLSGTFDATGKIVSRATLVVVAVSLVGQWCAEASSKLSGGLKMYPYHGQNRWGLVSFSGVCGAGAGVWDAQVNWEASAVRRVAGVFCLNFSISLMSFESLVGQWCAEASSKLSGGLKMYPYHGQNRWELAPA
jgi:hypothetical protein